jgi:hypothetical protein
LDCLFAFIKTQHTSEILLQPVDLEEIFFFAPVFLFAFYKKRLKSSQNSRVKQLGFFFYSFDFSLFLVFIWSQLFLLCVSSCFVVSSQCEREWELLCVWVCARAIRKGFVSWFLY